MPDRKEIEAKIAQLRSRAAEQEVRSETLAHLAEVTDSDVILYASGFTSVKRLEPGIPQALFSIDHNDLQGFMSATKGLTHRKLSLILHSPGGSPEAAEQIVNYLRQKFESIDAIIPQNAMSAATMIACACDRILIGKHAALGPIDPQMIIRRNNGSAHVASAHSILEEFNQAKSEISQQPNLAALWVPRIVDYPPGIFEHCKVATEAAEERVGEWLQRYMFKSGKSTRPKAQSIAKWLAAASVHKSHGRPLGFEALKAMGLKVELVESDPALQDAVLSVFHSTCLTFDMSDTVKVIENHQGGGIRMNVQRSK